MTNYLNRLLPKKITPEWIKESAEQHELFKILITPSISPELKILASQYYDFKSAGRHNLFQLLRYSKENEVKDKAINTLYPKK